jgi:hypothetical protein
MDIVRVLHAEYILIKALTDRGGPLASPLEFGLRLNTSGKDDTGSYNSEGNQSLSEEPVEISDLPKHKIKLTEKAR